MTYKALFYKKKPDSVVYDVVKKDFVTEDDFPKLQEYLAQNPDISYIEIYDGDLHVYNITVKEIKEIF